MLLPLILAALLFARSGGTNDDAPGELAPPGALATTAPSAAARVPSAVARLPNGGCSRFGNQVWAQSVYDADPVVNGDLDPDRIGRACDILPPGAAPALWTGSIPRGVEQVALLNAIDGDTIRVRRGDGAVELVRLVGVDTPETGQGTRALECYGLEATDFTAELLGRADGVIYLEQDRENRDRYGRLLRYVWFEDADGVYLVNEAIVRAGYG
ncbi:MAG: thermonuclease family protein, partial [Thermomicrobiales bacterium]|nr:thermonuclease family protein [Thermomicrobiales bacterium]